MSIALFALPWLAGFNASAVSDRPSRDVTAELAEWRDVDDRCVASAYGGLAIDVGDRRVLASYTQGVFVLGKDRDLVARAPALPCEGSADELVALAEGDAWIGAPVIALLATTGGRAGHVTRLAMYRVDGERLRVIFDGAVEEREGRATRSGSVTVFPGGLVYRSPAGVVTLWLYDRDAGAFVARFSTSPA